MGRNTDILNQVIAAKGVDPMMANFLHHTMAAESGGNTNARSSTSTATGLFQFINGTWQTMVRRHPNELTINGRGDPRQQSIAAIYYAQENAAALRANDHEVTPGNLYLSHFLGSSGANTILSADSSAPISRYVGAAGMSSNASIVLRYTGADGRQHAKRFADFTVGDLRAWADKKMGGRINYALLDRDVQNDTGLSTGEETEDTNVTGTGTSRPRFEAEGDLTFTKIALGFFALMALFIAKKSGDNPDVRANTPDAPAPAATIPAPTTPTETALPPAATVAPAVPNPAPSTTAPAATTPSGDTVAAAVTTKRLAVQDHPVPLLQRGLPQVPVTARAPAPTAFA